MTDPHHGEGRIAHILSPTRITQHVCVFDFKVDPKTGMKTVKRFPTCSCRASKTSRTPCAGLLKVMCSDPKINPRDVSYVRPGLQLRLHPCADEVAQQMGMDLELPHELHASGAQRGTTVYLTESGNRNHAAADGLVLAGTVAIKASALHEIASTMQRDSQHQSMYNQLKHHFEQCTALIQGKPELGALCMAALRALQQQILDRRTGRSAATVSTVHIGDVEAERSLGTGVCVDLTRKRDAKHRSASAPAAKKPRVTKPQRQNGADVPPEGKNKGRCQNCVKLGVDDAFSVFGHKSAARCLFNPTHSIYGQHFKVSYVVEIPATHTPSTPLKAYFARGPPLDFTLDPNRFTTGIAHRVRVLSNSARWVFSAVYDDNLADVCKACCPSVTDQNQFELPSGVALTSN